METRRQQLHDALMDAFVVKDMEMLLAAMEPRRELPLGSNKEAIFFDLIERSWREGWMLELAKAAYLKRAANEKIHAFAQNHLRTTFAEEMPQQQQRRRRRRVPADYDDTDWQLRLQRVEFRLVGIDGDNGLVGDLKRVRSDLGNIEREMAAIKTQVDQLLDIIQDARGVPAGGSVWTRWLFWLVSALVLLSLGADLWAKIALWMAGG